MQRLWEAGLLSFARRRRAEIQPFFVTTKGGKQRLVLDARRANQWFRRPPCPDMGAGEALQRLEPTPEQELFIGTADIRNCFYQCGVPPWLSEFFGFSAFPVEQARNWGAKLDVWGQDLPATGAVFPVLRVLPMGWSWSFYIVQTMHEEFLVRAGFSREQLLTTGWPAPPLRPRPIALPYCAI